MFNIGAGEMILIALVLLIAVGPEQLPGVIRRTGRVVGQLKTMSDNLRRDFNASLDEIERAADVKSWAGTELESTVEAVKDAATEPFKTDLGVDGSTKVTDIWSHPPAAAADANGSADEVSRVDANDDDAVDAGHATEADDAVDDVHATDASDATDAVHATDADDAVEDVRAADVEADGVAESVDTSATDEVA